MPAIISPIVSPVVAAISPEFRATIRPAGMSDIMFSAVDNLNKVGQAAIVAFENRGKTFARLVSLGLCEYLTLDSVLADVKTALCPLVWQTVTNYVAPLKRAYDAGKIAEFCAITENKGIAAALAMYKSGTGKKGAPVELVAAPAVVGLVAHSQIVDVTSDAVKTATIKADEAMAAMALAFENDSLKADNLALQAENDELRAIVAALRAELSDAAKPSKKAKMAA